MWESRGLINSAGSSRSQQRYTFTDPLDGRPGEPLWYRLRQTDFDGTYEYFGPINVNSALPSVGFELHDAYPNPVLAGAGTSVGYEMPADADVRIAVYDALGRECSVLASGIVPAGYHEVMWYPSSSLSEGIYYVTMRTASFSQTRKVTLLR